jgi:hypothetical protein
MHLPHIFDTHCSSQYEKVAPRQSKTVFELDRFQKLSSLVEIGVVIPRSLWLKPAETKRKRDIVVLARGGGIESLLLQAELGKILFFAYL